MQKKPTKEIISQANRLLDDMRKDGAKLIEQFWTLGRYDLVGVIEAKYEQTVMKTTVA